MENEKELLEKIAKIVGLSKDSVELTALPNLILGAAKDALKELATADKKLQGVSSKVTGAKQSQVDAVNRADDAKRMYSKVIPQLKELGLKDSDVPDLKDALKLMGDFNSKLNSFNSELKVINGVSKQ